MEDYWTNFAKTGDRNDGSSSLGSKKTGDPDIASVRRPTLQTQALPRWRTGRNSMLPKLYFVFTEGRSGSCEHQSFVVRRNATSTAKILAVNMKHGTVTDSSSMSGRGSKRKEAQARTAPLSALLF